MVWVVPVEDTDQIPFITCILFDTTRLVWLFHKLTPAVAGFMWYSSSEAGTNFMNCYD